MRDYGDLGVWSRRVNIIVISNIELSCVSGGFVCVLIPGAGDIHTAFLWKICFLKNSLRSISKYA